MLLVWNLRGYLTYPDILLHLVSPQVIWGVLWVLWQVLWELLLNPISQQCCVTKTLWYWQASGHSNGRLLPMARYGAGEQEQANNPQYFLIGLLLLPISVWPHLRMSRHKIWNQIVAPWQVMDSVFVPIKLLLICQHFVTKVNYKIKCVAITGVCKRTAP